MGKCICQICNCGKHRCQHYMPQRVVKNNVPCEFSEYQRQYKQNEKVQRGPIVKPTDLLKNEGDMDYNTTHKERFPAHDVQKRKEKPQPIKYKKNSAPMDLNTEYGTNYHPGRGEHFPLPDYFKKKTQPYGDGQGHADESVTHQDFDPKMVGEKPVIHRLTDNVELSDEPFDHQTTNQVDYTRFEKLPEKTGRRPDNIDTKGLPVSYETTNKEHFVTHKHQQRHQKLHAPVYQPNNKPFYGKSLMKSDFHPHGSVVKSEPFKIDNNLFVSDQPLDDSTTHNSHFQGWEVKKKPVPVEKVVYRRPAGQMDFNKTSDDYKIHGTRAEIIKRPKATIEFSGDFDGVTSYTDGYIKHDYVKEKSTARQRDYFKSDVPFDSTTESQDKYQRFLTTPSKPINHQHEIFDKSVPMANDTSYANHFQNKKIPECPSQKIVANNFSGYRIKDDFNNGHRFLFSNSGSPQSEITNASTPPPLPPIGGGSHQQQQHRYVTAH